MLGTVPENMPARVAHHKQQEGDTAARVAGHSGPPRDYPARETGERVTELTVAQDYACPYCWLAQGPLEALRAEGVHIAHEPFELAPRPLPLPDPGSAALVAAWERSVLPLAATLGMEIRRPALAVRTRKAHEAAAAARELGAGDAMHDAIFRAYFLEGADIARVDVLVDIGVRLGLDRLDLKVALDVDRYAPAVEAAQRELRARGIGAVPAYRRMQDDALLFGVRDTATLRAWLENHRGDDE